MKSVHALAVTFTLAFACALAAQVPAAHHEANFDTERTQANEMYLRGDRLQAGKLYEDLSRQDPTIAVFAERHASGLIAEADIESDPAKSQALHDRAMAELRRARTLGDNSDLVEHALGMEDERQMNLAREKASPSPATPVKPPAAYVSQNPQVQALMHEAEVAFAKNDTATAFAKYKQASELEPGFYLARLYTGDACFRAKDYPCAIEWFEKATIVDPSIETAYRYWGDALMSEGGHQQEAKRKYEEAVVANPYTRNSWSGLQRWAEATKTLMGSPPIQRPAIENEGKGAHITLPQGSAADTAVWSSYAGCRVDADHNRPANSRRTADEEVRCLTLAADFANKQLAASATHMSDYSNAIRALLALHHEGLLEPWVLLNASDQQTAQDYAAYRTAHRDLLLTYLDKDIIHQGVQSTVRPQLQMDGPK